MRDLQPFAQPVPSGSPRSYSRMLARLVSAALILLVAATAFVTYDVRRETILKCRLTGADRVVVHRLGICWSDVVAPNDVSQWCEQQGISSAEAGQCGCHEVVTVTDRWFQSTTFGESGTTVVPYYLYRESIADSVSASEKLRTFQSELITSVNAGKSAQSVQSDFLRRHDW